MWDFLTSSTAPWWTGLLGAIIGGAISFFAALANDTRKAKREAEQLWTAQVRGLATEFIGSGLSHYYKVSNYLLDEATITPSEFLKWKTDRVSELDALETTMLHLRIQIEIANAENLVPTAKNLVSIVSKVNMSLGSKGDPNHKSTIEMLEREVTCLKECIEVAKVVKMRN